MSKLKIDKEELENVRGELAGLFERIDDNMDEENFDIIMCAYNMARAILDFTVMMGETKDCFIAYGAGMGELIGNAGDIATLRKHPLFSSAKEVSDERESLDRDQIQMMKSLLSILEANQK